MNCVIFVFWALLNLCCLSVYCELISLLNALESPPVKGTEDLRLQKKNDVKLILSTKVAQVSV